MKCEQSYLCRMKVLVLLFILWEIFQLDMYNYNNIKIIKKKKIRYILRRHTRSII